MRELRESLGLSGNRFATQCLGWAQSRLSRVELGRQLPTGDDLEAWLSAAEASQETAQELRALLADARTEYESNRDLLRQAGGVVGDQERISRRYARANRVRHHQPGMIPGVLQTREYARELLSLPCGPASFGATPEQIEAKVDGRMRQQDALTRGGPSIRQYVIGEPALHSPPRSVGVLLSQLDRLAQMASFPGIEIAICPFGDPMPVIPLSGFVLYDDDFVTIETLSGEQRISDPEMVQLYAQAFEELRAGAAIGKDAVNLIRRVIDTIQRGDR